MFCLKFIGSFFISKDILKRCTLVFQPQDECMSLNQIGTSLSISFHYFRNVRFHCFQDAHWCKNSNQIAFIVSVMLIKLHRFFVMKKANQFKTQQITLYSYFTTNHHRCRRHCRHRRRWSFIVYTLLLNEQYWCMHAKKTKFNLLSNYIGWARSCYVLSLGLKMPNKWASTSDILFTYLVSGKVVRYGFINQNINHFRWICGDFQRKTQGFPTWVRQK